MRITSLLPLALLAAPALAQPVHGPDAVEVRARYICANGVGLDILYRQPTQVALVSVGGQELVLYKTVAEDGFRYIGGENDLRGKGDDISYRVYPQARVACTIKPPVPTAGVLTGTVAYRERIALPPGMTVSVELRDVSLTDVAAPLLAATKIVPTGNQVPLAWRLAFDPAKLVANHRYAVSARFTGADGKLRWINDTSHPVLTMGAPADDIDIAVVAVR